MVLDAGYPNTTGFRKVVKATIMIKKKEGMLDADFIKDMLHDYKCFAKFMYDPDSKALTADHDNFMVESQMKMMVGDEYMVIENGKRVG
ncbi:hypothetical protein B0A49_03437 [Cryomyces minteri]|uniref:EthD domain-containing protein n=1 Tax=Cryomyces minteri TaxID=331657 RepID=A0A4U0X7S1_9PEZI|nr:hypothetical protein B0A49_03437 [Cryomyces minteri]